jgi:NAD(P)-dependent dehydrogenase (short-subunit alcohol dehydrogenase family)
LDLRLAGKRVLVTGASQGIGRGIAEGFAAEGCHLVISARNAAALAEAAAALQAVGAASVRTHACDLAAPGAAAALAQASGEVDILVNNAGAVPQGTITEIDEVNIVGNSPFHPTSRNVAGNSGNAALLGFTQSLGTGSLHEGVRVVAINPGATETQRQVVRWKARAKDALGDESRWRELTTGFPLGRLARVDEIADMAVFLASERASYVSGTMITIDGGAGQSR